MGYWGGLLLICSLSGANARIVDVSTVEEEKAGPSISRPDISREKSEIIALPQEEKEDPSPVFFNSTDASSAGGGVRLLDPKYLDPKTPPSAEPPWWERWWGGIMAWFTEE